MAPGRISNWQLRLMLYLDSDSRKEIGHRSPTKIFWQPPKATLSPLYEIVASTILRASFGINNANFLKPEV